jgi:hypothetical protein
MDEPVPTFADRAFDRWCSGAIANRSVLLQHYCDNDEEKLERLLEILRKAFDSGRASVMAERQEKTMNRIEQDRLRWLMSGPIVGMREPTPRYRLASGAASLLVLVMIVLLLLFLTSCDQAMARAMVPSLPSMPNDGPSWGYCAEMATAALAVAK